MASDLNYTDPLSGSDVVADLLGQIRRKLTTDCNLRQADGYSGGYSGEVKIKLRLNAVRSVEVEMEIPIAQSPELPAPAPETFPPEDLEPIEIDELIMIPVNDNLVEVRERIAANSEKALEAEAEEQAAPVEVPEGEATVRQKRKYTRRQALVGAVSE